MIFRLVLRPISYDQVTPCYRVKLQAVGCLVIGSDQSDAKTNYLYDVRSPISSFHTWPLRKEVLSLVSLPAVEKSHKPSLM